ncbi:MAG: hypothetical protein AB7E52_00845 [Bdellovibrionales bacterium]
MSKKQSKPQGVSGPIRIDGDGVAWDCIRYPDDKAERERLIARLFVEGCRRFVLSQSEPSLAPFGEPRQNAENDLDFTVATAQGEKLMELVEFAPLKQHGPRFCDAPLSLEASEKTALVVERITEKAAHQGGPGRFLVMYATEHSFRLDPSIIERVRRRLVKRPPAFDRVYYVAPHDLTEAMVFEIFPGTPHSFFTDKSDEELEGMRSHFVHPTEWEVGQTASFTTTLRINGQSVPARIGYELSFKPLERPLPLDR